MRPGAMIRRIVRARLIHCYSSLSLCLNTFVFLLIQSNFQAFMKNPKVIHDCPVLTTIRLVAGKRGGPMTSSQGVWVKVITARP